MIYRKKFELKDFCDLILGCFLPHKTIIPGRKRPESWVFDPVNPTPYDPWVWVWHINLPFFFWYIWTYYIKGKKVTIGEHIKYQSQGMKIDIYGQGG